jgi:hypothetical protein
MTEDGMTDFLDRDLLTVALCWRLERGDGIALGFTNHDRDLRLDGLTYRAAPGMLPSAISLSDGFDPASLDIAGALTSDAIRSEDLRAGRWDGAALSVFMTDWEAPGVEVLPIARGVLGEVSVKGDAFEAELAGRRPCSTRRQSSRPRPNAAPSSATRGAAWTWRRGRGSRGSLRSKARMR